MAAARVPAALVSSSPDAGTRMLYEQDPERIVPFLRPYFDDVLPRNWFKQQRVLSYFEQRLGGTPGYTGIGELHLHYGSNADAPVMRATVKLAVARDLYLHVHANAPAIATLFAYEPRASILWAHAGMTSPPQEVAALLDRYQRLWIDISIREHAIAPQGKLNPDWRALFLAHPDRITIGSDTWVPSRWDGYQALIEFDRAWLAQLPQPVAEAIAFRNAVRLFGASPGAFPDP